MNAVDFIKQSLFYTSEKYEPICDIVTLVLSDELTEADLDAFVDSLAPLEDQESQDMASEATPMQQSSAKEYSPREEKSARIISIKTINQVSNIGLISKSPPINLTSGLNIFYGYNASGKTSLYKGICNCLGLSLHSLNNVNVDNAPLSRISMSIEDAGGKITDLSWPSQSSNEVFEIKLFDSRVSLSLVQDEQESTFSLVHLKQEYFTLLADALDSLVMKVEQRKQVINKKLQETEAALQERSLALFDSLHTITLVQVQEAAVSEEERQKIHSLETKLATIEKQDIPTKVTVLSSDTSRIEDILSAVAVSKDEDNESGSKWELVYDESYIEKAKGLIVRFNEARTDLQRRAGSLDRFLPPGWAENALWLKFINAASSFLRSLAPKQQRKHKEYRCPYCQQALSRRSKQLLAAYDTLQDEAKDKLEAAERAISVLLRGIEDNIRRLRQVEYNEKLISAETKTLGGQKTFDLPHVLLEIQQVRQCLIEKSDLDISLNQLTSCKIFFEYYLYLHGSAVKSKNLYKQAIKDKQGEIQKLIQEIKPLKLRQLIVDNHTNLVCLFSLRAGLTKLTDFRIFLTVATRLASTLATNFSNEVTVHEFQRTLDSEYSKLGFQKPTRYRLTSRTSAGTTKRVYNVADRHLRDILSEGEQKQHALADFFAQIELDCYRGLIIFDDPVTSLDQCNIEKVAHRIVDLASCQGNQIIVFTHNVFFLNCLIESTGEEKVTELMKSGSEITINPGAKLGTDNVLKRSRKLVETQLADIDNQPDVSEQTIRAAYDLLSNYIETAVEVSLFKGAVGRYRPNIRIQSLRNVDWDVSVVNQLVSLYNRTSRKCIRHSQPASVPPPTRSDLKADAQEILELVKSL